MNRRLSSKHATRIGFAAFAVVAFALSLAATDRALAATDRRVVVIVVDQCRADYPDRFPMVRLNELRRSGVDLEQATVGHLASETVVSHLVLASGLLPRSLPWGDEVLVDAAGALGPIGSLHLTSRLSLEQMEKLLAAGTGSRPESLPQVIRAATGGRVYAIGVKDYAVHAMASTGVTSPITPSRKVTSGPFTGWQGPDGRGLPSTLVAPVGNRFYVDGRDPYGTSHLEYLAKGNLYLAGNDPRHEGGDLWAANVTLEVMKRDPGWRGLLVTLGSVDRVGHTLGEMSGPVDLGQSPMVHLDRVLETADRAIGRIVDRLRADNLLDRTLIVVTSDHGAMAGRPFVGDRGPGRGYDNWYFGKTANAEFSNPSRAIRPLADLPFVRFITADAMVRAWLSDSSTGRLIEAGRTAFGLPGVEEVHILVGGRYRLLSSRRGGQTSPATRELLATLAAPHAPHVVALLDDRTTYGTPGDHGGHQESNQRIPLILHGPDLAAPARFADPARLVDIVPTVRRWLGLPARAGYDGRALDVLAPSREE